MFSYFQHDICKGLERQDFFRFAKEFRKVIFENIPTIQRITFLDPPELQPAIAPEEDRCGMELQLGMKKAVEERTSVIVADTLLLPFEIGNGAVIAQVEGLDSYLLRKVGNDWLDGLGILLFREFLLVKRSCIDSLTGLLSSLHLEECIDGLAESSQGIIVLISLYPKGTSSFQAKKYQHHNIALLKTFIDNQYPLYYLGQSCFGLLCENCGADFTTEFAPALVNYFKRERCARVHVAVVPFENHSTDSPTSGLALSEKLMEKAWSALHVASKRGPFAFCNYSSIENAADHPLAAPAVSFMRWFRNVSRKFDSFGLLQFNSGKKALRDNIKKVVGEDALVKADNATCYLLLPEKSAKECLKAGKKILQHLGKKDTIELAVNCGISSFPFSVFKKSELPLLCRKALCHAAFFEPGSLVICDAVSFNISGDIYFADGDLVLAVKEYQRGLLFDSMNGNLLNSLGVCYAQMNRHKMAVDCFQRACKSKNDRFMALYNLGLEQQINNENEQAIQSFNDAFALPEKEGEEKARLDMSFQLAVLFIHEGQYEQALDRLLSWDTAQSKNGNSKKGLRYLGEAYYGVGKSRDAMKYLQQAMRYDEYDAEVLGLLGEIYLAENEGDDIALRFSEKAVELNPDSRALKVRLASAQIQCGDFNSALKTLQPCLRNKKTRPAALVQRGLLAQGQGRIKEAEKWFLKATICPGSNPETVLAARNYLNNLTN